MSSRVYLVSDRILTRLASTLERSLRRRKRSNQVQRKNTSSLCFPHKVCHFFLEPIIIIIIVMNRVNFCQWKSERLYKRRIVYQWFIRASTKVVAKACLSPYSWLKKGSNRMLAVTQRIAPFHWTVVSPMTNSAVAFPVPMSAYVAWRLNNDWGESRRVAS